MKTYIYVTFVLIVNIILYLVLNKGYDRIEPEFYNITKQGLDDFLRALLKFDFIVAFLNIVLLFFGYKSVRRCRVSKFGFITIILYFLFLFNILNSLAFSIKNYNANHDDIFELNVFIDLINKHGSIVNLIYFLPLLLSIVVFLIFHFFRLPREKEKIVY